MVFSFASFLFCRFDLRPDIYLTDEIADIKAAPFLFLEVKVRDRVTALSLLFVRPYRHLPFRHKEEIRRTNRLPYRTVLFAEGELNYMVA